MLRDRDLPQENQGVVPGRAWKEQTRNERWTIGDTYNVSIGQGDVLVTPLQLAVAYASIANGGARVTPYIVESVTDKGKNVLYAHIALPERLLPVESAHIESVREALRETVTDGTAWWLTGIGQPAAGKTGTAQAGPDRMHAWIASFAPFQDPELVLVVLVENGGQGSSVAGPAAAEIYEWYFANR